ncbi:Os02g0826300 [Oryza sativa Japonica Group]|jgi:hypothetical protein|uniref:Os02g0826300 protein n=5 Tax=Oryza TaxID=4527 RepID=A3ACW7_ORYSJ|nr:hypothetical protein OsI_09526 [Oryza sativa Indica Group]EAZ25156.1 hypothetical protein OsJ_08957 [Oryza sativa Japonica Group]KAB8089621.1 hypothetical protein EE612_014599 [Oryza sativa]KAF2947756.1 hypothetical protein DAI22_02g392200 [Oryza sativa Japonica Group]BAD23045.1 hypothetical protein [Oryza sativa Japonica Group]|eukprot:NP_001173213.1 Os02g0826300 [Oryza sativa Japonica Group]
MRRFSKQHLVPFILLLLLVMSHLPISSLGSRRAFREEAVSGFRSHELAPTMAPSQEKEAGVVAGAGSICGQKYAVSRRMVPQGPNPLHN